LIATGNSTLQQRVHRLGDARAAVSRTPGPIAGGGNHGQLGQNRNLHELL
jgi:hypothetical protein